MRTDRQKDMTELIFAVRNVANAPKNDVCGEKKEEKLWK